MFTSRLLSPLSLSNILRFEFTQAVPGDYLSKIAFLSGVPLATLLVNNSKALKDLDAPLAGKPLLLCGTELLSALQGPPNEIEALINIRQSMDQRGNALGEWSEARKDTKCQWQGVLCDKNGRVTALQFIEGTTGRQTSVNSQVC